MNAYSFALEPRDEDVRMFTIKKDVNRYDSVVGTQAFHAAEKLLVVIGQLWRASDG
jgi:hypothetical protein